MAGFTFHETPPTVIDFAKTLNILIHPISISSPAASRSRTYMTYLATGWPRGTRLKQSPIFLTILLGCMKQTRR